MKVLHLAAGNLFGGVESYLLTLARLQHLCPEMEPHFGICFPGRLRDELTAAGIPVHDLGTVRFSRPWTLLRGRSRLKRVVKEHRLQIVVTHGCWPHAVFAPAIRKVGVGLINAIHDYIDSRHWINRWAARELCPMLSLLTVVTPHPRPWHCSQAYRSNRCTSRCHRRLSIAPPLGLS